MPPAAKKQKVAASGSTFFPGIKKISYEGPDSTNPLAFKYYK